MSFDQFRETILKKDVLRANRYKVSISGVLTPETEHLCMEATLPSENIQSFEYAMAGIGPLTKVPNRILFDSLSLSFLNLGNNEPYNSFRQWISDVYDDFYRFNDMNTYVKTVQIDELNRQNEMVGRHKYYECYPQIVGPKSKNAAPSNTPEIFPVVLNYETSELQ